MSTSESAAEATREAAREAAGEGAKRTSAAAREDGSPLYLVALRDVAVGVAAFSVFGGAEAWAQVSGLGLAVGLSTLAGLLVGAVGTGLVHEWGHFVGARLSGAAAPLVGVKRPLPVFLFDMERSSDDQFRAMSVGGNVAHWAFALLLLLGLPDGSPGLVALQAGSLGFVAFASVIEIPVIRRCYAGESRRAAFAYITRDLIQRAARVGLGVTLVLFLLL